MHVAPPLEQVKADRLEEQPVGHRRRPLRLGNTVRLVSVGGCLRGDRGACRRGWRGGRPAKDLAVTRLAARVARISRGRSAFAGPLLVPVRAELVPGGRLRRQPQRQRSV